MPFRLSHPICYRGTWFFAHGSSVFADVPIQGLSPAERSWREARGESVLGSLRTYLTNANITGLDIPEYVRRLNSSTVPVVGMSISGGGSQSGIGGLGIWQAFDERYGPAVEAGTGGLAQLLYYITGLSGGGAVTVSAL
jgi:lysophospholipase